MAERGKIERLKLDLTASWHTSLNRSAAVAMSSRKRQRSPEQLSSSVKREQQYAADSHESGSASAAAAASLLASVPVDSAPVKQRRSRFGPQSSSETAEPVSPSLKHQISYEPSGALHLKESTSLSGTKLKYTAPFDARAPTAAQCDSILRLYVFKDGELLSDKNESVLQLHSDANHYLLGRDAQVCHLPLLHSSISKQHAVIQFRLRSQSNSLDQTTGNDAETEHTRARIHPYLMDLNSANGTRLNNQRIEAQRYYQLLHKDKIQFGESTREYVVMLVDRKKNINN